MLGFKVFTLAEFIGFDFRVSKGLDVLLEIEAKFEGRK